MCAARAEVLTEETLAKWPLPDPGADGDKETRGRILVIAGSREIPGAALLAATAALRTGAGKLAMAAPRSIAQGLALAIPESRVIALAESRSGGIPARASEALAPLAGRVDALVIGPGMLGGDSLKRFVREVLALFRDCPVVLDALAMSIAKDGPFDQPVVLTPHPGEMAGLSGLPKEAIGHEPLPVALEAATRWNAVVALKGATTIVATPEAAAWRFDGGSPGLATSGSGDTLAGLVGGFAARGLSPLQATCWGVLVHARAGDALARRHGALGYLARELSPEVPALIHGISQRADDRRPSR